MRRMRRMGLLGSPRAVRHRMNVASSRLSPADCHIHPVRQPISPGEKLHGFASLTAPYGNTLGAGHGACHPMTHTWYGKARSKEDRWTTPKEC